MFQKWFWPVSFVIGGFLVVTYTICLSADAIFSGLRMYTAWEPWLPGVAGLSFGSWVLGVVELALYSLYASVVLVGLTAIVRREERPAERMMAQPAHH